MSKSAASTSSTRRFSRFMNVSPRSLLENVIEYIMPNISNEVPGVITEGRHKCFSEDVGKAVRILMIENRLKPVCDQIREIVFTCEFPDTVPARKFLNRKMWDFESLLSQDDQIDYLMYLAIVCELISALSTSTVKYLITRVIDKAKLSMVNHAVRNNFYQSIGVYAKDILAKRGPANEMDWNLQHVRKMKN